MLAVVKQLKLATFYNPVNLLRDVSEQGRVCLPAHEKTETPQHFFSRTSAKQMHFRTPTDLLFRRTIMYLS